MKKRKKKNLHVIFLAAVLIILIVIVAKILIWNLGVDSDFDPNNLMEGFDTEVTDIIMYNSADKPDDGVNHVLLIGNSPVYDGKDGNKLSDLIEQKTGAIVDTIAFPNALAASYTDLNIAPTGIDAFSFYRLCYALANNDYYHQDQNIDEVAAQYGDEYRTTLAFMKSLDMSDIDTIVISYDAADYYASLGLYNPSDDFDIKCFKGAFYTGATRLKEAYPDINIVFSSIYYVLCQGENGELLDGASVDLGNGPVYNYFEVQLQAAANCSASFIDNYYGTITPDNYEAYLEDHVHLNDAGREVVADRISEFVKILR